jgi:hypothetical protein
VVFNDALAARRAAWEAGEPWIRDAADRFFASFMVEVTPRPLPKTDAECGIGPDLLGQRRRDPHPGG